MSTLEVPSPRRPEWLAAAESIRDFVANVYPSIANDEQDLRVIVRNFARSMPAVLTESEQMDLNDVLEEALGGPSRNLRGHLGILTAWDQFLGPPADNPRFADLLEKTRDLGILVSSLDDIDLIHDAIENFAYETQGSTFRPLDLGVELDGRLTAEFFWHVPAGADAHEPTQMLYYAYCVPDPEGFGLPEAALTPEMWDRIFQFRPGQVFYHHQPPPRTSGTMYPSIDLPDWFSPEAEFDPKAGDWREVSYYEAQIEGHKLINETIDFIKIKNALRDNHEQMFTMVDNVIPEESGLNPGKLMELISSAEGALVQALQNHGGSIPHPNELLEKGRDAVLAFNAAMETVLQQARVINSHLERYLITMELLRLTTDNKTLAYLSRWERAKMHRYIDDTIAGLKTPRLKQIAWYDRTDPTELPPLPKIPFADDDPICAICFEEVTAQSKIVVTKCCKNGPFDLDCLLTWLLEKIKPF